MSDLPGPRKRIMSSGPANAIDAKDDIVGRYKLGTASAAIDFITYEAGAHTEVLRLPITILCKIECVRRAGELPLLLKNVLLCQM